MFDRWTSDIAEVKIAASGLHNLILAEMDTGVKASINTFSLALTGALEMVTRQP